MSLQSKRLDLAIVEKGLVQNRQQAKATIMAGMVQVNNQSVCKPGTKVLQNDSIKVIQKKSFPYVSRGGIKLEKALRVFNLPINKFVCLDAGASTGGFTDCLLQHKALKVYAVDVGYGQIAWTLRQNNRVIVIERSNVRYLTQKKIPELVDLITIDVSFISLKIVVPELLKFLKKKGFIIALIKPQFEVGKGKVGKKGVVRDTRLHDEVIDDLSAFFSKNGLIKHAVITSPLTGPKGNMEFFILLSN